MVLPSQRALYLAFCLPCGNSSVRFCNSRGQLYFFQTKRHLRTHFGSQEGNLGYVCLLRGHSSMHFCSRKQLYFSNQGHFSTHFSLPMDHFSILTGSHVGTLACVFQQSGPPPIHTPLMSPLLQKKHNKIGELNLRSRIHSYT